MPQSPDIGQNSHGGISDFRISGQSLKKENCHDSRTSDDIDIRRGPLTKFYKKKKHHQKNLTITSRRQILMLLSFFRFMTNLKLFGSRIPDE